MPGHTVATTPANKCVVTPLIHNLAAESAAGVLGPDRHSETTAEADPEERSRDTRLKGIGESKKPRTCPRDAVEG